MNWRAARESFRHGGIARLGYFPAGSWGRACGDLGNFIRGVRETPGMLEPSPSRVRRASQTEASHAH
jgi:hypothetical protein